MKITDIFNTNEKFENLKIGDFFIYDNDYYMKISNSFIDFRAKDYGAIGLREGNLQYIPGYKSIIKLNNSLFEGLDKYVIPNPKFNNGVRVNYLMERDPGDIFYLLGSTYIITDTRHNDDNTLCVNLKTGELTALNKYHLVINLTDSVEFKAVN